MKGKVVTRKVGKFLISIVGLMVGFFIVLALVPESHAQGCSGDRDCDGLSDVDESWFIETFKPILIFDEEEFKCLDPFNEMAALYQVTLDPLGRYDKNTVLITVIIAYTKDCGGASLGDPWSSHPGDLEMTRLIIREEPDKPNHWYLHSIMIKRHGDEADSYDAYRRDSDDPKRQLRFNGYNPILYVSESKHAMYPSVSACEGYGSWYAEYEDCGGGPSVGLYTPPEHNVGERYNNAFDQLSHSGSNWLASLFPYDYAWSPDYFCGGPEIMVGHECPGGFGAKWWVPTNQSELNHQSNLIWAALSN